MGCFHSAAYDKITTHPRFAEWMEKFGALQISKTEALKLYAVFHRADLDGGGTINLLELLTVIDLERTPFTKRVFSIFDDDGSGDIDFGEFVLALWNYCTLSKVSLAMFAFDLYDRDSTGILETHDLESMVKDIYGKAAGSSHYAKQVAKELAELEAKGEVGLDQFLEFSRTHHSLLWPAFQMQLALKKKMMGVGFWQTHAERRVKLSKNKYMKIKDLLQLHAKGQIDTAVDASLAPQTQVLLESMGTKADRRARQQKAQESVLFEGKSKKEQEFLKNYITGDYNMAAATMTKQQRQQQQQAAATAAATGKPISNGSASAKYAVDATADLSSKSGSGDNHDHDFPAMSVSSSATAGAGSTSAKTLTGKKKSMVVGGAGGGKNILQTVLEDINAKEKEAALQDELDEQAQAQQFKNKLKNIVKPAQDMSQLQHQQQEKRASFLQSSMQALGMDTQVIQHVASTPSTKGPITINTNKVAASSTPSMSALVANSHHEAGSLQNTRASWFGGTTASSRVVPTSNVSAKVGGSTATATNTASSVISPRSSVKMAGGSASSAGGATSALSPSSSMFASSGGTGTGTAMPIDPIAMLLSPSANGAAGSPDRRGSMRPNMAAMEPSDSNNATVNLMATHKKRAQQRRASVG